MAAGPGTTPAPTGVHRTPLALAWEVARNDTAAVALSPLHRLNQRVLSWLAGIDETVRPAEDNIRGVSDRGRICLLEVEGVEGEDSGYDANDEDDDDEGDDRVDESDGVDEENEDERPTPSELPEKEFWKESTRRLRALLARWNRVCDRIVARQDQGDAEVLVSRDATTEDPRDAIVEPVDRVFDESEWPYTPLPDQEPPVPKRVPWVEQMCALIQRPVAQTDDDHPQ
ncbi:hypothetical protein QBC44DRAFT_364153 [Cladorrhinum sp. PSN332]|nr:hypothetical protein QBC44DRAFT_364153 [Cladorrhinum sp. PSN332]